MQIKTVLLVVVVASFISMLCDEGFRYAYAQGVTEIIESPILGYECVRQPCVYDLTIDNKTIPIRYSIPGEIEEIKVNTERKSLVITINSTVADRLQIELPRSVIQALEQDRDVNFIAYTDGNLAYSEELGRNDTARGLFVNYEKGTKQIEIVGTWVIPEFSAVTVLILGAAITAVIVSSFTKGRFFRKNVA